jgi:REP element-mobilizing transposase RayT
MARERRTIDPDSIYHVMCRGSDRRPIVFDATDYESLSELLSRVATRYEWEVFAWCVMPNHYHVILRTTLQRFSRGFQVLNQTHSIRTNRRYGRSAHLFRNRPHGFEVKSQAHLIAAIAYVVRNPIRAGLCNRAWEWPYSSYRATVGLVPAPAWLAVKFVLDLFGGATEFARFVHSRQSEVSDTFAELLDPTPV